MLSLEAFVRRSLNRVFLTDMMVSHESAMGKGKLVDQTNGGFIFYFSG